MRKWAVRILMLLLAVYMGQLWAVAVLYTAAITWLRKEPVSQVFLDAFAALKDHVAEFKQMWADPMGEIEDADGV